MVTSIAILCVYEYLYVSVFWGIFIGSYIHLLFKPFNGLIPVSCGLIVCLKLSYLIVPNSLSWLGGCVLHCSSDSCLSETSAKQKYHYR